MRNEKLWDAIGMLDEAFLEEALKEEIPSRKRIPFGRTMRNILAAVLAVAMLGCVVWAVAMPEEPEPQWEPYADADTLLDILFGTRRYTPHEGTVDIRRRLVGSIEDETAHYEEVRVPILSGASREPVSRELAALVEPYIIPVGKTVVDPTGTITLEVMAYYYEPESQCGAVYLKLTDPTGEFCGYVAEEEPILLEPGEEPPDRPRAIQIYLQEFSREWGHSWAYGRVLYLRHLESLSDDTTWTYVSYFFCDNYNIVDMDYGFVTEPTVDYRPYRIDIDLEKTPTMDTVVLGNAGNKELITISPVGMHIQDSVVPTGSWIDEVVIHFDDGSSYVVVDDVRKASLLSESSTCTFGYAARENNHFAFANIIDVSKIYYVEVNGRHYFQIDW